MKTKKKFTHVCVDVDTGLVLSQHYTERSAERYLSYHRNGIYREYGMRGMRFNPEVREIA